MKASDFVPILIIGGIAYYFATRNDDGHPVTDVPFEAPIPQLYAASTTNAATGAKETKAISSVKEGVEFINRAYATPGVTIESPGATLVESNTRFEVAGKTYETKSNQTVSRLADGQIKVLTVNPVKKGTSFWDKPIKVINGKRTRVY